MTKFRKTLIGAVALLAAGLAYAQRPAELNERGEAYLRVNINPTDIPPMVNINPYGTVPTVAVSRMPDIRLTGTGCGTFRTGIASSISGPLMITYLNIPEQAKATLADAGGAQSVSLGAPGQITTAIFLQAGQRLELSSAVLYSGCQPTAQ